MQANQSKQALVCVACRLLRRRQANAEMQNNVYISCSVLRWRRNGAAMAPQWRRRRAVSARPMARRRPGRSAGAGVNALTTTASAPVVLATLAVSTRSSRHEIRVLHGHTIIQKPKVFGALRAATRVRHEIPARNVQQLPLRGAPVALARARKVRSVILYKSLAATIR